MTPTYRASLLAAESNVVYTMEMEEDPTGCGLVGCVFWGLGLRTDGGGWIRDLFGENLDALDCDLRDVGNQRSGA